MKNPTNKGLSPRAMAAFRFGIVGGIVSAVLVVGQLAVNRTSIGCGESHRTACALELAINNFYLDYDKVPNVGAKVQTDSEAGVRLLSILLGDEKPDGTGKAQNPRASKYLNVRETHTKANGLLYDRSGKSVVGLYDSWGNPFVVELEVDNTESLRPQLGSRVVNLKGRRVVVYSAGPDKTLGTPDDVKTW